MSELPQPGFGDQNKFKKRSHDEIRDLVHLEEICSAFESGWTRDSVLQIEELVQQITPENGPKLVFELLSIDFELCQESDPRLSRVAYVARLPVEPS